MLEPAGLGLLLGGEGVSSSLARALSLSLYRAALMVMMAASASDFLVSFQESSQEGRERRAGCARLT